MKNLILSLLIILSVSLNCKISAQTLSIEELGIQPKNGAYYKDKELLLNNFVGNWEYQNGNTILRFELKKIIRNNPNYSEDILVGEYRYVENGIEKINTLDNINSNKNKEIEGNTVIYFDDKPPCKDCTKNEKRLRVTFSDPIKHTAGALYLRTVIFNGQEAISALFMCDGISYTGGPDIEDIEQTYVGETVPNGVYILIKKN